MQNSFILKNSVFVCCNSDVSWKAKLCEGYAKMIAEWNVAAKAVATEILFAEQMLNGRGSRM